MSKGKGSSDARKVRRGKVKFIFLKSIEKFFRYRLTTRGWWVQDGNSSAKHLSKHKMNSLVNPKN